MARKNDLKVLQANPLNSETPIQDLRPDLTEDKSFYIRSHFASPRINRTKWKLTIELDGSPIESFSYEEILKMRLRTVTNTLECAGNGRKGFRKKVEGEIDWGYGAVSTAFWKGVPLSTLIKKSGLSPRALNKVTEFIFVAADGSKSSSVPLESKDRFSRNLPPEKALDDDTIVAIEMNGKPLTRDHGFPARMVVPGWYAMASIKWLDKIILSTNSTKFQGHFTSVKYVYETRDHGRIIKEPIKNLRVKSMVTYPNDNDALALGKLIIIEGKAWSGFGEIEKVQVDFGTGWEKAELPRDNNLGPYAWKSWRKKWIPTKQGNYTLRVRAKDKKGNIQPEIPEMNKYLYGYNAVQEIRLKIG